MARKIKEDPFTKKMANVVIGIMFAPIILILYILGFRGKKKK